MLRLGGGDSEVGGGLAGSRGIGGEGAGAKALTLILNMIRTWEEVWDVWNKGFEKER